jgi:hypothetical protein
MAHGQTHARSRRAHNDRRDGRQSRKKGDICRFPAFCARLHTRHKKTPKKNRILADGLRGARAREMERGATTVRGR